MKASTKLLLLLLAALVSSASVQAQGTAFSYQGRLNQSGNPTTGIYDLRFTPYGAPTDPTPASASITVAAAPVTNGLFTVTLDFGAGLFTGAPRWLEIAVRTNGAASFTTLEPRQLVTAVPYAIHAGSASDVASGKVVTSLNNLRDNVSLLAGDNITLTPSGNTLTISSAGGSSNGVWSLNGGSAFYNSGNVGIGTSVPSRKLTVRTSPTDYGIEHTDGNVRLDTFVSSAGGFLGTVSNHKLHLFVNDGAARLTVDTSGAVGIGSFEPVSRLTVAGAGAFNSPLAAALTLQNTAASSSWQWHALDDGRLQLADFARGATRVMFDPSGAVGIGTTSPQSLLHLYDPVNSVSHLLETDGEINAWTKVAFKNQNGLWEAGTSRGFNNDVFYIDRAETAALEFQLAPHGGLGIGIEPQAKLHLYNGPDSVSHRIETGGGVNAWARTEYVNANGQWMTGTSRDFNGDQFYIHRLGAPGILFGLQPSGDAFLQGALNCRSFIANGNSTVNGLLTTRVLTITGGADIAEPFQMSSAGISKGSVVVIDEENPGHLKLSTQAYDRRVAGIVSGANGVKPGISLHQEGLLEGGENVALSGRVYVQADASIDVIRPGDLLTTSDTPGHAMKVSDRDRSQGSILGKAMTGLREGRGMVLVLVTLQ